MVGQVIVPSAVLILIPQIMVQGGLAVPWLSHAVPRLDFQWQVISCTRNGLFLCICALWEGTQSAFTRKETGRSLFSMTQRARESSSLVRMVAMSKAVADPEEIRRFAQLLKRFGGGMEQQLTQLNGQMANLSQTWRDQEQAKFQKEFEDTMRQMARFREAIDQQVPFLLRKADRLDEYLRQR